MFAARTPLARQSIAKSPAGTIAAAAVIAGLIVFFTSGAPIANANTGVSPKVDRSAVAVCSAQAWPHFDTNCQFDLRKPDKEARVVRVLPLH